MVSHSDAMEFIRIGLAGICALAFCALQYDAIKTILHNRNEDREP